VHLAEDTRLRRRVALKVLSGIGAASGETLRRFQREAEVASRLDHPGICAVYELGSEGGVPYLAMRHVPGRTLARLIAERREAAGPASETPGRGERRSSRGSTRAAVLEATHLIERVARALHVAHEAGIVHRDVKPGNLMVTPEGEPVILDFGLARLAEEAGPSLTMSGDLIGTPAYLSPEQLRSGRGPVDRRTDVYSLGVTLYEALTLRRPFEGPTREALYRSIELSDPPDPRRFTPSIPKDLGAVLDTALEKDPDRRYATALDFAEDLRRVRELRPVAAQPISAPERAVRWARRHPAQAALAAVLVLGLPTIAGLAGYVIASQPALRGARDRERRDRAERHLERGYLELGHGSKELAEREFQAAVGEVELPEAVAGLVLLHLSRGQERQALEALDRHRALEERVGGLRRLRADALHRLGRHAEADAIVTGGFAPETPVELYIAGFREIERSHHEGPGPASRAVDLLSQAVLLSEGPRALLYFQLAHAAQHAGDEATGRRVSRAIRALWPDAPAAYWWAGNALVQVRPEEALPIFEEGHRRWPEDPAMTANAASCLLRLGRPGEALPLAREALAKDPRSGAAWAALGGALVPLGQVAEAAEAFAKASELEPDSLTHRLNLGSTRGTLGDLDGAVRVFREGLRRAPGHRDLLVNLAHALEESGEFAEAAEVLAKAGGLDDRAAELRRWAGLTGRLEAALAGREAVRDHTVMLDLCRMCQARRQPRAALRLWEGVFEAHPSLVESVAGGARYYAAVAAAQAGLGRDLGPDPPGPEGRAALRQKALRWLKADLAARVREGGAYRQSLAVWRQEEVLALLIAPEPPVHLPEGERDEWRRLRVALDEAVPRPAR
jgi:tetratricopeptide (TPR) repeat protein